MTDPLPAPEKIKTSELAELRKKAKAYDEGAVRDGDNVVERDTELAVKIAKLELEVERLKESKAATGGDLAKELNAKWDKMEGDLEALRTQLALAADPPKKAEEPKLTEKEERAACQKCGSVLKVPAGSELAGEYECTKCGAPLSLEA